MAIDYNSGSGVFDKMGPVVKAVNDIDTYETGNFTTDMNGVLGELKEDMDQYYQRQAHSEIFTLFRNMEKTFWSLKEELAGLIEPILAGELIIQDGAEKRGADALLDHLRYAMFRDNYTIDENAATAPSGAYVGTESNDVLGVLAGANLDKVPGDRTLGTHGIDYDLNTQWAGVVFAEVVDISRGEGKERIRFSGESVRGGKGSPDWDSPVLNQTVQILSTDHPNNILPNGNFEHEDGVSYIGWTPTSGSWGSDILVNSTVKLRGKQCLELASNSTIYCDKIPSSKFKPRTLYVLGCWAYSDDDSDLYGLWWDGSLQASSGVATTGSWAFYFWIVDTAIPPTNASVGVQRQNKTSGSMYIDEVFLMEVPQFKNSAGKVGAQIGLVRGATGSDPVVGDRYKFTLANTYNGTWATFFSRYFDKDIPSWSIAGGATGIADALAE